jgi:hypothetical protein
MRGEKGRKEEKEKQRRKAKGQDKNADSKRQHGVPGEGC